MSEFTEYEWLPLGEAAKRFGLSPKALDNRGKRGTAERRKTPDGYRYKVPPQNPRGSSHPSSSPALEVTPEVTPQVTPEVSAPVAIPDPSQEPESPYIRRRAYVYDRERDIYIINVKKQPAPVLMDGDTVRAIQAHYTGVRSVDETCREFQLTREVFNALKRALEITQGSHPLTREEVRAKDLPALIMRAGEVEEAQKYAKLERDKWKAATRDALKWRDIKRELIDKISQVEWPLATTLFPPLVHPRNQGTHTVLIGTTDFHVGKRPFGSEGDIRAYEDHLFEMCKASIHEALVWGEPKEFVVLVGSDLLHCDTFGLTTTRGTPQGAQSVGSIFQHFDSACRLMARVIDEARRFTKVRALWVPGNHDEVLSYAVAGALRERYSREHRVTVDMREDSRKVVAFGSVPVMFTHGHNIKPKDYVGVLARELPAGCDIQKGLVIQGHHHTHRRQVENEYVGVQVITLASPAPADDWHHHQGYGLTRKHMSVLRINNNHGLDTVLLVGAKRRRDAV